MACERIDLWYLVFVATLVGYLLIKNITNNRNATKYFIFGMISGLYFDIFSTMYRYYVYSAAMFDNFYGIPITITIAEGFSIAIIIMVLEYFFTSKDFRDKTVVITGGTKGIGKELALQFIEKGANIIILSRTKPDKTLKDAVFIRCDVSNLNQVRNAVKNIKEIDILINNAGVGFLQESAKIGYGKIRRMIETNYYGSVYVTRELLSKIKRRKGTIVFMSSLSGKLVTPRFGAYCASKFAITAFASDLEKEIGNVLLVYPGPVKTRFWEHSGRFTRELFFIEPQRAARAIIRGISKKQKEVYVPYWVRYVVLIGALIPDLVYKIMKAVYIEKEL